MELEMHKKNAIVTGAGGGLGLAVVEKLASQNVNIWACLHTKREEVEKKLDNISYQYNVWIEPVYFDAVDSEMLERHIKKIVSSQKNIDILVNLAGVAHGGFFQMTPINEIRNIFEINFFSCLEITQLVLKRMYRQKSGSIINVASIAGIDLDQGNAAYGTSKAALIAWSKTLAAEMGRYNIRVNAVAPGLTDTKMASLMDDRAAEKMIDGSAMKRLGKPDEIAKVIGFLASDEASFVNGDVIRIDGGKA